MRVLAALLAFSSCTFMVDKVPDDADISCVTDRDCPTELWRCVPELKRCVKLTKLTGDAPSLLSSAVSPELTNAGHVVEWSFVASADLLQAPVVSVLDGLASPLRRITAEPSGAERGWVARTTVDGTEQGARLLATVKLVGTTARSSPELALPSVRLDFAPPQPGRTSLVLVPRTGCPLPSVRSLGTGGQALVSIAFDEDLDDAGVPTLNCVVDGGTLLGFHTDSREQPFLFVADTTGLGPVDSACGLEVSARDVLGNTATKPVQLIGPPLTIDTIPPEPPVTSTRGAFVLERAPWPTAPGGFTGSRLRVSQPVDGTWLFASATSTPLSPLGFLRPDAGSPATVEFPFVDRPTLYATAVDDACNESTGQLVTETNFLYGLVRTSVATSETNPSRAFKRPLPTGGPLPLGQDVSSALAADAGGLLLSSVGDWRELLPVNRSGSGGCVTDFLRGTVWVTDGERLLRWDEDHLRLVSVANTPSLGVGRRLAIDRHTGAVVLVSSNGAVIARYDGQWTVANTRGGATGALAPLTTPGGQLVVVANPPWYFDGGWAQPVGTGSMSTPAGTMLSDGTLLGWFSSAATPQIQRWSESSRWTRFADAPSVPVTALFADEPSGRLFAVGASSISRGPLDGGPLSPALAFDAGFAVQAACLVPRTGDVLLLANRLDAGVTGLLQFLDDGGVSTSMLGDAGTLATNIQNAAGAMIPFEGRQVPALVWGTIDNAFHSQVWANGGWRSIAGVATVPKADCFVDVTTWSDSKAVNVRHTCTAGLKPDRNLKDVSSITCVEAQWGKGVWEAVDSGVPCATLQRTAMFGSERLDVVGAQPNGPFSTTSWSNQVLVGNKRWTTMDAIAAPSLLPLVDGGLASAGQFELKSDGGLALSNGVFVWAGDAGWARQPRLPLSTSGSTFVPEPLTGDWWAPFTISVQSSVGLDFTIDPLQAPVEAPVVLSSQGTGLRRVEVASREGVGLPRPRMLPAVVPDPTRATVWLAGGRVVEDWDKEFPEAWEYSWAQEYPAVMLHWKAPSNTSPGMVIDQFVLEARSVSGPTTVSLWTSQGLVQVGTFDMATTRLEVAALAGRSFEQAFADLGSLIFELRRPGPNFSATSPVSIVGVSASLRYRQP